MAIKTVKAVINGVDYILTKNETTGKYEGTATAPSKSSYKNNDGHYYPVEIIATDVAGNTATVDDTHSTLGNSLKLKVKEKGAPVITIVSPSASAYIANNKPTITWKVTDSDSGVNANTIGITIDSGSKITSGITKTAITNGYSCSYTPTQAFADGKHTIKIDASDNDGNAATQKSATFTVDTTPPTLSVTSPAVGLVTNNKSLTVSGSTNDALSSSVKLTVKVNSGSAEEVSVDSDGTFKKVVTLAEGTNTIVVTATDGVGKTTTVTRTVTLDTVAPVFNAITITPNPVDAGKTYVISVDVVD